MIKIIKNPIFTALAAISICALLFWIFSPKHISPEDQKTINRNIAIAVCKLSVINGAPDPESLKFFEDNINYSTMKNNEEEDNIFTVIIPIQYKSSINMIYREDFQCRISKLTIKTKKYGDLIHWATIGIQESNRKSV